MRKFKPVTGEYYHIYNRGVDKRCIFSDKDDLLRFVECIKEFNDISGVGSLANLRKEDTKSRPKSEPLVAIVAYCINPNHFHFLMKQLVDDGISRFMKKIQGGYSYYFNVKNSRSGSLFQGQYKAQPVLNDSYFNKLLGYVNKNYLVHDIPIDLKDLLLSGDVEYLNGFNLIDKSEGKKVIESFNGIKSFEKHCTEIVEIIRKERGKQSLLEEDNLP